MIDHDTRTIKLYNEFKYIPLIVLFVRWIKR